MNDFPGSVSVLLRDCLKGDAAAFTRICLRYRGQVVALARRRLAGKPHCALADEQDVAQQALIALHGMIMAAKPLVLDTRERLLALLSCLVARHAWKAVRAEAGTIKRAWTQELDEAASAAVADPGLTPEEEVTAADLYEQCLLCLPEAPTPPQKLSLRRVGELHLAGLSHREIARELGCAEDTVERALRLRVKPLWQAWAARFSEAPGGEAPSH